MGFPGGSDDEQICLQMWETQVQALGWEDPLEKGMATHSSQYSWLENPWTKEPGELYPWDHKEWDTTERLTHTHI